VSLTTFPVTYREPNANMQQRYLLFVRARTDDGLSGWGEAVTQFGPATRATATLVADLADLVVGRSALDNLEIWQKLRQTTWWYGYRGGIVSFAIAAIDMALWDLKGKLLGQSLSTLLGGARQPRLPAIAATITSDRSLEEEAELHANYVRDGGLMGIKVGLGGAEGNKFGSDAKLDAQLIGLIRESIGADALLAVDRLQRHQWDLQSAIWRAAAFSDQDVKWLEEPFEPTDVNGFRHLRSRSDLMLAGGEREWDEAGYTELIEREVVDVVGCDPGRANGVTGLVRVIEMIERGSLWFNSHSWSSAVNTAASIALSASTTRCLCQEIKPVPSPMQEELIAEPFIITDGWIEVPTAPGLGVEPDEAVLRKYDAATVR
jgi:L-alanine-DL-glutamate epimerase-like enolase superfamily enzyme